MPRFLRQAAYDQAKVADELGVISISATTPRWTPLTTRSVSARESWEYTFRHFTPPGSGWFMPEREDQGGNEHIVLSSLAKRLNDRITPRLGQHCGAALAAAWMASATGGRPFQQFDDVTCPVSDNPAR